MSIHIKDNRKPNFILQEGVLLQHPDTGVYGVVVRIDIINNK